MNDRRKIPRVDGVKVGNMADALRVAGFALEMMELNGDTAKLPDVSRAMVQNAQKLVMDVQADIWKDQPAPVEQPSSDYLRQMFS